jgi:hypothetical protein
MTDYSAEDHAAAFAQVRNELVELAAAYAKLAAEAVSWHDLWRTATLENARLGLLLHPSQSEEKLC